MCEFEKHDFSKIDPEPLLFRETEYDLDSGSESLRSALCKVYRTTEEVSAEAAAEERWV